MRQPAYRYSSAAGQWLTGYKFFRLQINIHAFCHSYRTPQQQQNSLRYVALTEWSNSSSVNRETQAFIETHGSLPCN
jgi:hypothetical protein